MVRGIKTQSIMEADIECDQVSCSKCCLDEDKDGYIWENIKLWIYIGWVTYK